MIAEVVMSPAHATIAVKLQVLDMQPAPATLQIALFLHKSIASRVDIS